MDFHRIGKQRMRAEGDRPSPLPYQPWENFPLFFTVEYPVSDFAAEVGFWTRVFGADFLSLSDDYAIVENMDGSTFSFKQQVGIAAAPVIRLQWFTDGFASLLQVLDERNVSYEILQNSAIQRFARLHTPGGITVEIWSGDESKNPADSPA